MKKKNEIRARYTTRNTLILDRADMIPDIATVAHVGGNPTADEHEAWLNTAVAIRLLPKLQSLLELVGTVTKGASGGRLGRLAAEHASLLEAEQEEQRVARHWLGDGPQVVAPEPEPCVLPAAQAAGSAHSTTCGCGCTTGPVACDFPPLPTGLPALPEGYSHVGAGPLFLRDGMGSIPHIIGAANEAGCEWSHWSGENCNGSSPRFNYAVRTNSATHIRLLELRGWSPPLPSGLPAVPEGYRYAGAGPLPLSGREMERIGDDDVLQFTYDGSPNEWTGNYLRGNGSRDNHAHYVIKIGGPWDLLLRSRLPLSPLTNEADDDSISF